MADVAGKKAAASRQTNRERNQGIPLEGWRIAARLQKLNPNLFFEVANADARNLGIYYLDPLAEGGRRFICGMYCDTNPEIETDVLDDKGECIRTIRGWRTVLSKLIRAKFITEAGTFRLFGPPSRDSERWMVQVC